MRADDGLVDRKVRAEIHLDDAVDAATVGQRHHRGGHILLAVVDGRLRPEVPCMGRFLRRTHRGDHARAAPGRELDGIARHRSGPALHKHGLARDGTVAQHRVMRRHEGHAEAGSDIKAHALRQGDGVIGMDCRELGRSAGRMHDPDPLADAALRHAGTHGFDDAGAVGMGDDAAGGRSARPAGALLRVMRVDAGPGDPDQHLARSGLRPRQVAQLEHLRRRPAALVPDGAHRRQASAASMMRFASRSAPQ